MSTLNEALDRLRAEVTRAEAALAAAQGRSLGDQMAAAADVYAARLTVRSQPGASAAVAREAGSEALASLFGASAPEPDSQPASAPPAASGKPAEAPAPAEIDWSSTDAAIAAKAAETKAPETPEADGMTDTDRALLDLLNTTPNTPEEIA